MKSFIQIYDNILSPIFIDKIESILLKSGRSFPYYFSDNLTTLTSTKSRPGVFHGFLQRKYEIQSDYYHFILKILYDFAYSQNLIVNEVYNIRSFLEFPSPNPGTDFPPHVDLEDQNGKVMPHWVLLYYVNDAEGDTIFYKDDKTTEIKRVSPKRGRIAFFDGSIYHCGSRSENTSRSVINFNFIGEKI